MEIKIESDIEMPEYGYRGAPLPNYPKTSEYPWGRMKLGDSFFVELPDGCDIVRLMNSVTGSAAATLGAGTVSARCVKENGRIGVRAWLKLEK